MCSLAKVLTICAMQEINCQIRLGSNFLFPRKRYPMANKVSVLGILTQSCSLSDFRGTNLGRSLIIYGLFRKAEVLRIHVLTKHSRNPTGTTSIATCMYSEKIHYHGNCALQIMMWKLCKSRAIAAVFFFANLLHKDIAESCIRVFSVENVSPEWFNGFYKWMSNRDQFSDPIESLLFTECRLIPNKHNTFINNCIQSQVIQ